MQISVTNPLLEKFSQTRRILCKIAPATVLLLILTACGPKAEEDLPGDNVSAPDSSTTLSKQTAAEVTGTDDGISEEPLPSLIDYAKAEEATTAGTELLTRGKYQEAFDQFAFAAKIDTENEEVFFNLGFALSRLGRDAEAIEAYQRTIEIFEDYGEAHNNLGNLFVKQGKFKEAVGHFETALEINPEHAAAHNNLGKALSRQNLYTQAIPHYVKATQLDKMYIQAWCNLGNSYLSQSRFEDAGKAFQNALRINPNFKPALSGIQRLRVQQGQPIR